MTTRRNANLAYALVLKWICAAQIYVGYKNAAIQKLWEKIMINVFLTTEQIMTRIDSLSCFCVTDLLF